MGGLLTGKKRSLDIDGKQSIKFIFLGVRNALGDADPGIVYQNIQPAKMRKRLLKKPLDVNGPGNIRLQSNSCAAARRNRVNDFFSFV